MATKILKFLGAIVLLHVLVATYIPYGELINAAVYLWALWNLVTKD